MPDPRIPVKEPITLHDSCPECGEPIVGGMLFVYCTAIAANRCSWAISWDEYNRQKQLETRLLFGEFEDTEVE